MKKKTLFAILFATLAVYGCSSDDGNPAGSGGSGGTGGTAGSGGSAGTGGTAGTGGSAGTGGDGGTGGMAGEVVYEQNFNLLDIDGEFIGDDWLFFVNVFAGDDTFKFGYGGDAPNGPQVSALVEGEGGSEQEPQQLDVYSDYNCCDLGMPVEQGHGNGTDLVETNVFRETTVAAEDVGTTLEFSFQAKAGNIEGDSTANAFIKTLDPGNGFSVSASDTEDTTLLPDTWGGFTLSLAIDGALVGHILQVGFQTNASDFVSSGNFYDNVVVTQSATAP